MTETYCISFFFTFKGIRLIMQYIQQIKLINISHDRLFGLKLDYACSSNSFTWSWFPLLHYFILFFMVKLIYFNLSHCWLIFIFTTFRKSQKREETSRSLSIMTYGRRWTIHSVVCVSEHLCHVEISNSFKSDTCLAHNYLFIWNFVIDWTSHMGNFTHTLLFMYVAIFCINFSKVL